MKIKFNNEIFQADNIIKTDESITGYDHDGKIIFQFKGINDFSLFELLEGNYTEENKQSNDLEKRVTDLEILISEMIGVEN